MNGSRIIATITTATPSTSKTRSSTTLATAPSPSRCCSSSFRFRLYSQNNSHNKNKNKNKNDNNNNNNNTQKTNTITGSIRSRNAAIVLSKDEETQKQLFDAIGKELGITQLQDWYQISRQQMEQHLGMRRYMLHILIIIIISSCYIVVPNDIQL